MNFFKEQNFRKENEIFNCFKWNLQHYLFIYLFTQADMCWGCPCHTRMWREAKPVVFSRAMHFEMLVSKWFWAIVWHMNCSCKVYCWVARSEVTTRRLPTNSWNINYLLLQRDLNDGCSWPTWVHVGGMGSTALVHVWINPIQSKAGRF